MPKKAAKKIFNRISKKKSPKKGFKYHIDYANKDVISGWAINSNDPERSVALEVRSGKQVVMSVLADAFRPDLEGAGLNGGRCAFSGAPNLAVLNSEKGYVDLYMDNVKVNNKPMSLYQPEENEKNKKGYACFIDSANAVSVVGWAKKNANKSHSVTVELRCGDVVIAEGLATEYRHDLDNQEMGDGNYGFKLKPKIGLFPSEDIECDVYLDNIKYNMKAVKLSADRRVIEKNRIKAEFSHEIEGLDANVKAEILRLNTEVSQLPASVENSSTSHDPAVSVALKNIAELSARVSVIEKILLDKFS